MIQAKLELFKQQKNVEGAGGSSPLLLPPLTANDFQLSPSLTVTTPLCEEYDEHDEKHYLSDKDQQLSVDEEKTNTSIDMERLFKICNQDINLLRKLYETNNFQCSLSLYNKLINLYAKYSMKPIASNLQQMAGEVILCVVLFLF
jgi:hypothetical protein